MPNTKTTIHALGVKAREALASVEQLTAELQVKTKKCLDQYRRFGAALEEAGQLMPGKTAYGRWVHAHQLDTGLASRSATRSDSRWLAVHWVDLQNCKTPCPYTHPSDIHSWWRQREKTRARDERRLMGGLPVEIRNLLSDSEHAGALQQWTAREMVLEVCVTRADIAELHEHVAKAVEALVRIDAWAADNGELLTQYETEKAALNAQRAAANAAWVQDGA